MSHRSSRMLPKRRKAFFELSRTKRRDRVFSLRQQIKKQSADYQGVFASDHILDNSLSEYCDTYFMAADPFLFYNATVLTARQAFWDEVTQLSFERTWNTLSESDHLLYQENEGYASFKKSLIPFDFDRYGKPRYYEMRKQDKITYKSLGNQTFNDFKDEQERDIIKNFPPDIHEEFIIDSSYIYGIGLTIIIDANSIGLNECLRAIEKFREVGEPLLGDFTALKKMKNKSMIERNTPLWRNDTPIERNRLPTMPMLDYYRAIRKEKEKGGF